jgi:hypothetical protein
MALLALEIFKELEAKTQVEAKTKATPASEKYDHPPHIHPEYRDESGQRLLVIGFEYPPHCPRYRKDGISPYQLRQWIAKNGCYTIEDLLNSWPDRQYDIRASVSPILILNLNGKLVVEIFSDYSEMRVPEPGTRYYVTKKIHYSYGRRLITRGASYCMDPSNSNIVKIKTDVLKKNATMIAKVSLLDIDMVLDK